MLNQNYTAKLLNLEDVIITNVENIFEELHIYVTQFNVIEEAKKRGFDKCEFEEGYVDLTAYGKSFCSICLATTKVIIARVDKP